MSGRENGKKLLSDLASKVRKELLPSGEPALHARGQKAVADLAADLSHQDGLPGLRVFRDSPDRFRIQRPGKNAEIAVAWQRPIGAVTLVVEYGSTRDPEIRYVHHPAEDEWRRMDSPGELYGDIAELLTAKMYPEGRR